MNAGYNGWVTRETWLVNLHGFTDIVYESTLEMFGPEGEFPDHMPEYDYWCDRRRDPKAFSKYLREHIECYLQHLVEEHIDQMTTDCLFIQDLMPDWRPYRDGGVIGYKDLAWHVFWNLEAHARYHGWEKDGYGE